MPARGINTVSRGVGYCMGILVRLYRSSLGKKYIMGVTGLLLFGFVIAHMAGNLQIFLGPNPINEYAVFLKSKPLLLWSARLGLLALAALHITAGVQLALQNRQARQSRYEYFKVVAASFAARTILASGLVILAFVVYHLAHFTFGFVDPQYLRFEDPLGHHDVYRMMVAGFSNPLVSAFYIVATGLLCLHLSHGLSSTFQSLGLRSKKIFPVLDKLAKAAALVIFLGNSAIPVAILAGIIR